MDVDDFGVLTQQSNETKNDDFDVELTSHNDSMSLDYFDDFRDPPQYSKNLSLDKSIYISNSSQSTNDFFSITNEFNLPSTGETDFSLIEDEAVSACENDLTWQNDSIFKALSYSDIEHQNLTQLKINKSEKNGVSRKRKTSQSISQVSVRLSNPRNESFLSCSDFEFDDNWSQEIQLNKSSLKVEKKIDTCNESKSFYGLPEKVKSLIYEVKKIDSLYEWQNECLSLPSIKNRKNLIYSLPTSGGKTLVAKILMFKEIICYKKNAIFILPFISIVQEKLQTMAPYAVEFEFLLEEYAAVKGQYPPIKRRKKNSIYICTIEKSLGLINSLIETNRLDEIGMVVVDELHLLGENGGRGACLEVLLTKLMFVNKNIHIIGMSATIGNLEEVAKFLKADTYVGNFRPVELKEYVKCEDQIWNIDVREENIFQDEKKVKYPYSPKFLILDPDKIGGLVMDVVPNDSCLIFCATKKNCECVAELLTRVLFNNLKTHKVAEKKLLLDALKAESKLCPILAETIKYGVAYHHSGLTAEERRLIEDAFREGVLCVICATSTLAAGVNLPAKRVILRKPYIGNQFMNLSRYKQMIGRAGRAGMGKAGESILICKRNEMKKVQEMLISKMDDCLSTLHEEIDRGINYLILSSILLSLVNTREQIYQLISFSLLGLQAARRSISLKEIIDVSIEKLIKSDAVLIDNKTFSSNLKFEISSQELLSEVTINSQLTLSTMVKAAMKATIDLKTAYILTDDLKLAQKQLILLNDLHLLYLITPYDYADKFKPDGSVLYDVITNLPETLMDVSRLLGINEITVTKLRDGIIPKNVPARVISRFYLTLILYELNQQKSIFTVAQKYNVDRGLIQNIGSSAATFANSIIRFCQEIPEFWAFPNLLKEFNKKLIYGSAEELEMLMELPTVKAGRARQLYKAGYKTLQSIAIANAKDLAEKIRYIPKSSINRIIASANLLLQEKIENLKDEYAEMMDGLDPNILL